MSIEIDETALNSILDEVTNDLMPVLKSEADRLNLRKGDDGPPPEKEEKEASPPAEESSEPSGPPSPSPEASGPPAPPSPSPEASASPAGAPPPGAGSPPPAAAGGGMPSDPAQLQQMLAALPMEQTVAIYMAAKQIIFQAQGPGAGGAPPAGPGAGAPPMADASAGGPPPPGAGSPPPMPPEASASPAGAPPPMPPPPMGKGEMKSNPANGDDNANPKNVGSGKMGKAEKENSELRALLKSQGEDIAQLTKIVKMVVQAPVRKAVTSIAAIKKNESTGNDEPVSLTKSEVTQRLTAHTRNKDLAKTDRAAITKFYDTGSTNVGLIAHLLKQ